MILLGSGPVDLADILEELPQEQRLAIFGELDTEHASDTLEEIEPRVQRHLVSSIKKERVAELINDMTPAQAADILAILPAATADNVMELLDKHEEKIINFSTSQFIKVLSSASAEEVLEDYRNIAKDKDEIMYLCIVDREDTLLGVADMKEVLQADPDLSMEDIMTTTVISLNPEDTLREASELFSRYSFRAIPVTDDQDKILGVIPYRDIMNLKHRFV